MNAYARAGLAAIIVFFCLDFIWLSQVSAGFYREAIGPHLADNPDFVAAAAFYLLYFGGLMYFVIAPAVTRGTMSSAVFSGVLFGLVTYGTYDLTNMATLRDWPLRMALIDMAWGAFLSASASAAAYWFAYPQRTERT